ncbi:MAG: autotransporter-associated beta strand repeat-containing protein [Verrucomicrobia bacterium]|nr:autotransporter-associated beta strand repeat-containing protein [Verrucomicrobiota bacterium]
MSKYRLVASLSFVFYLTLPLFAATDTWTGAGNGNWSDPNDWSNGVPGSYSYPYLIFDATGSQAHGSYVDGTFSAETLTFASGAPAYTITIDAIGTLNIGTGIVNNSSQTQTFAVNGQMAFLAGASAGNAMLNTLSGTGSTGGTVGFYGNSFGNATAANATITNQGTSVSGDSGGTTTFNQGATAGNATITSNGTGLGAGSGSTTFQDNSTAGNATLINNGGITNFESASTAANAHITNNAGGYTIFSGTSSAASATISGAGDTLFGGNSTAGTATINGSAGSYIEFTAGASAASANITATGTGASINFHNGGTAGNATLTANSGATMMFANGTDGGTARALVNAGATFDVSYQSPSMSIGSIEGAGTFELGGTQLTVGSNNLSTTVSGVIQDQGSNTFAAGGSIVKVGTGTLTLSGNNTYTGGTIVNVGGLQVGDGTHPAALVAGTVTDSNGSTFTYPGINAITLNNNATVNVMANATVTGGHGGAVYNTTQGGVGGTAVVVTGAGALTNHGTLVGGTGGASDSGPDIGTVYGPGGVAVDFKQSNTFTNAGTITGGTGGGNGGTGVLMEAGGSLTNAGTINGGTGGTGTAFAPNGGTAVSLTAGGSVINSGTIAGGGSAAGGASGSGVMISGGSGTLENDKGGSIQGGVSMGNYANNVTLQIGSSITGDLNMGNSTASALTLTDNGTGGSQTYSSAVTGMTTFNGALTKSGRGTWNIDQAMSYSGGTTIAGGTLISSHDGALGTGNVSLLSGNNIQLTLQGGVTNQYIASTASLSFNTNNKINLNYVGADQIAALILNGQSLGPGIYNSIDLPGELTGTGDLLVVPEPSTWALMLGGIGVLIAFQRARVRRGLGKH